MNNWELVGELPKPGSRIYCPGCHMVLGINNKPIYSGTIMRAEDFDWHPEFPKFISGERFDCKKCKTHCASGNNRIGFYVWTDKV